MVLVHSKLDDLLSKVIVFIHFHISRYPGGNENLPCIQSDRKPSLLFTLQLDCGDNDISVQSHLPVARIYLSAFQIKAPRRCSEWGSKKKRIQGSSECQKSSLLTFCC